MRSAQAFRTVTSRCVQHIDMMSRSSAPRLLPSTSCDDLNPQNWNRRRMALRFPSHFYLPTSTFLLRRWLVPNRPAVRHHVLVQLTIGRPLDLQCVDEQLDEFAVVVARSEDLEQAPLEDAKRRPVALRAADAL